MVVYNLCRACLRGLHSFIVLVVFFCVTKECWQCYVCRRERAGLVAMIRDQMSVEMRPMMPGRAYPDLAPTAPVENLASL